MLQSFSQFRIGVFVLGYYTLNGPPRNEFFFGMIIKLMDSTKDMNMKIY